LKARPHLRHAAEGGGTDRRKEKPRKVKEMERSTGKQRAAKARGSRPGEKLRL